MNEPTQKSNVVSLGDLRKKHEQATRRAYLDPVDRIRDLEADVLRLVDHAMDLEERLFRQERYLSKLTRLLGKHVSGVEEK